jgi:hypothetical protein
MANQLIDGDQAIVATCITAATMLAGQADFIFQSMSANNPATVQAVSSVPLTFVPSKPLCAHSAHPSPNVSRKLTVVSEPDPAQEPKKLWVALGTKSGIKPRGSKSRSV